MNSFKKLTLVSALSLLATGVIADPWEPGFGVSLGYSSEYEMEGEGKNAMDGDGLSLKGQYASASNIPFRLALQYGMSETDHSGEATYSGASAESDTLQLEAAVGKAFIADVVEFIPSIGVGYRDMSQDFDSDIYPPDNDIATPERTHRHLYIPIGLYAGTSRGLDKVDVYGSVEYRKVVMGEASVGYNGQATMNSSGGDGVRVEAGLHFPGWSRANVFAGVYYDQWNIDAGDKTVTSAGGVTQVQQDPKTETYQAGITIGIQF